MAEFVTCRKSCLRRYGRGLSRSGSGRGDGRRPRGRQAAVGGACVVTWPELAQIPALFRRGARDALADQLTKHPDEPAMRTHGPRANHRQAQLLAEVHRLHVEIIENFHVVGEKPDRMDDQGRCSPILQVPEVIENVGLEPGVLRPAASALIYQGPAAGGDAQVPGYQPARFLKLRLVAGTP